MKWIVWIGTIDNPKAQKKEYDNEDVADKMVAYLTRVFSQHGLIITKESI